METSTIISIQNQLVTHINKTIKASTDDEIVVDKTILTCCPADEDIRLIMDTKFRKLLINDGLFYTGVSNSDQLCIQKIKSYPIDYTNIRKAMKMSVRAQDISSSVIDMYLMLYYDETNNIKKFKLNEEKHKFNVPADTIFVLGGIEGEGTVNMEDLKSLFNLYRTLFKK